MKTDELHKSLIRIICEDHHLGRRRYDPMKPSITSDLTGLIHDIIGKTLALYHWGELKNPDYLSRGVRMSLKLYALMYEDLGVEVKVFQPFRWGTIANNLNNHERTEALDTIMLGGMRHWGAFINGNNFAISENQDQFKDSPLLLSGQIQFRGSAESLSKFGGIMAGEGGLKELETSGLAEVEGDVMKLKMTPEVIQFFCRMIKPIIAKIASHNEIILDGTKIRENTESWIKNLEIKPLRIGRSC